MTPNELMRKMRPFLKVRLKEKNLTDDQLIIKMIKHPKLIDQF